MHSNGLDSNSKGYYQRYTYFIIQNIHILKYNATICRDKTSAASNTHLKALIRISDSPAIVKHKSSTRVSAPARLNRSLYNQSEKEAERGTVLLWSVLRPPARSHQTLWRRRLGTHHFLFGTCSSLNPSPPARPNDLSRFEPDDCSNTITWKLQLELLRCDPHTAVGENNPETHL